MFCLRSFFKELIMLVTFCNIFFPTFQLLFIARMSVYIDIVRYISSFKLFAFWNTVFLLRKHILSTWLIEHNKLECPHKLTKVWPVWGCGLLGSKWCLNCSLKSRHFKEIVSYKAAKPLWSPTLRSLFSFSSEALWSTYFL